MELLERRLPIIIREFSIRRGSGGKVRFNGGDGIIRDWMCRVSLTFSIISERRVLRPYGMHGGDEGANGVNFWAQLQEVGTFKWVQLGHVVWRKWLLGIAAWCTLRVVEVGVCPKLARRHSRSG